MSVTTPPAAEDDLLTTLAPGHNRFPCVDGLRAIAAVAVVLTHIGFATGADTSTWAGYVFAHLDVGVSIFFVLSGFLLYRPFAAAHLSNGPGPSVRRYAARRLLRIYPAYWVALTFFVIVGTIHLHNPLDVVAFYGLIHVYWRNRALGGIVAAWSLAVEVSFYLFLPVYAMVIGWVTRRLATPTRRLRAELAGVVMLYIAGLVVHALLLLTHAQATVATLWLPSQIDLFALGMGLAVGSAWAAHTGVAPRLFAAVGRHPGWCWLAAAVAFTIAATALHLPRAFGDLPKRGEMGRQVLYGATGLFLVLPAVAGPQHRGVIRRLLRSRTAELLGLVSYGIFLYHHEWITELVQWGAAGWFPQARFLSVLVVTLALTVPCAILSYLLVERPLINRTNPSARI